MGTFSSQISRDDAAQQGREAVKIGESGSYLTHGGQTVDLKREIARAVQGTITYLPDSSLQESMSGDFNTQVEIINETSLSAATRLMGAGLKTVVLNFASATSPGGGFLSGARAQEEYLARSSCLYQCIRENPMYAYHRAQNDPFYSDTMLYSPEVPVIRGDDGLLLDKPYAVSMITAAAVHAKRVPHDRQKDISPAMRQRILKVLAVGVSHGHDGIVLGAWGCGAFGNDGTEISKLFYEALTHNFRGAYRHVIFAIVDWSPEKKFIGPFEEAFRDYLTGK